MGPVIRDADVCRHPLVWKFGWEGAFDVPRHGGGQFWSPFGGSVILAAVPAQADTIAGGIYRSGAPGMIEIVLVAALVGSILFAIMSGALFIRDRHQRRTKSTHSKDDLETLRLRVDRAESLLDAADQRIIVFDPSEDLPLMLGNLSGDGSVPAGRSEFLAFGQWLAADAAGRLDRHIADLRDKGLPFTIPLESKTGIVIEAAGRIAGPRTYVRFNELSSERLEHAELQQRHQRLKRDADSVGALLEAFPDPVWVRNHEDKLTWVNPAYATHVGAEAPDQVTDRGVELLDAAAQSKISTLHAQSPVASERITVVTDGKRRRFDITDVKSKTGAAGIAIDISELEQAQDALRRTIDFHARTLDQLATAVAVFGADQKLRFYNAAYQALWGLDPGFLDSGPEDGTILDQLRAGRKLPEQADFRSWKAGLMESYRAVEGQEHWWHLPDGQTLRILAIPHPQGGVTYVYENVTEKLALESRFNALTRVQGETLDNLSEGVVVFGPDGRVRLYNPAFCEIWKLAGTKLDDNPHASDIVTWCSGLYDDPDAWRRLADSVTAMIDHRDPVAGRMERRDGSVVDYATVPLPDGATLATFVDVTDSVNVERALLDKNDALEQAGELKNAFIQHVSYELRSPLTNIIGFAQLLTEPNIGPQNDKQREYTDYILSSSSALLAIVNDILDLATIDAGIMELELLDVDAAETAAAAIAGLKDRIAEAKIELKTEIPDDIGSFVADEKRIRQILFNLLSNAIAHSTAGGAVTLTCARDHDFISFSVRDEGDGIPSDQIDTVFDRFVSRVSGSGRRGAGLGLSIVKSFVDLHGGTIDLSSNEGDGTVITCRFPIEPDLPAFAAAE